MLPIVVYLPNQNANSGGMTVMHNIANDLNIVLKDAAYVVPGRIDERNAELTDITPARLDQLRKKNPLIVPYRVLASGQFVALYPEVIPGNPLRAKHVLRWILLVPPAGISSTWSNTDKIIEYLPVYIELYNRRNPHMMQLKPWAKLFAPFSNYNYCDQKLPRHGTCFTVRKAFTAFKRFDTDLTPAHDPVDSVRFEPGCDFAPAEMEHLFSTSKVFYSYDPFTFHSVAAAMCGCLSVVVPVAELTAAEYRRLGGPLVQNGIAYGDTPDELIRAQQSALDAAPALKRAIADIRPATLLLLENVRKECL